MTQRAESYFRNVKVISTHIHACIHTHTHVRAHTHYLLTYILIHTHTQPYATPHTHRDTHQICHIYASINMHTYIHMLRKHTLILMFKNRQLTLKRR